ncbi:pfs domain-containing protein [Colletotrichum kahawae]|uniref:Pfs domain-containing protein n=1 Tax=Colletotrichum kahawae TaxID=34407 RepID=A0AAD9YWH6_COLKA|nr:pfs domain-containing protein [Colletotrichum kahawae]
MADSFELINANTTFPVGPFPKEITQLCNNVERLSSVRRMELRVENSKLYELPDVEGSPEESRGAQDDAGTISKRFEVARLVYQQNEHSDQSFFFDGLAIKATPDGVAQILRKEYEEWRKSYQAVYSKFITHESSTASEPPKVKIAILDTGIDKKHPGAPQLIKKVRNWMNQAPKDAHDTNGHGTATGCLLYEYAPDAEFYIAKVSDAEPASPEIIAQAIIHAVDKWNVDIISMSFGYPTNQNQGYQKLRDSIDHASSKHVLLFAAASNNGRNSGIAFPAREEKVIAVRATNNRGKLSSFSPTPCRGTVNLATIGKAVSVASLGNGPSNQCPAHEIRSGTSYATPIVAGMAAFLLLYTRKKMPDLESRVKDPRIMKLLFQEVARVGNVALDDYDYVYMSLSQDRLFGKKKEYVEDKIRDILKHS